MKTSGTAVRAGTPVQRRCREEARRDPPYAGFARAYDRLMGHAVSPLIRESFELACSRYGIRWGAAADVGCGTGTLLRHLAAYGAPVLGVDVSEEMLRQAAAKNGPGVQLLQQDLRQLALPNPVDLITCTFATLNYLLSPGELRFAFSRFAENLRPGGHVYCDLISGGAAAEGWRREVQQLRLPGMQSQWIVRWSARERRSIVSMRYRFREKDGSVREISELHPQRWYEPRLVRELLGASGFEIRGVHDVSSFSPAAEDCFWVCYVARKGEQGSASRQVRA